MKRVLIALLAISMMTGVAFAHDGPPPGGGHGPGDGGGRDGGGGIIVASDGSAYVTKASSTSTSAAPSFVLAAIRSTGSTAWSVTINGRPDLTLSGSNLINVAEATASDGTVTSTLTAYSTASGTAVWTRTLNGRVQDLRPFSGGTYAVVVVPATTSGGTPTRSLVAIGNDGSVLWTVAI
jgi:hypothetical protein